MSFKKTPKMRPSKTLALASFIIGFIVAPVISCATDAQSISLSGFRDSASHWRHIKADNAIITPRPNHPSYAPAQIREIAANILLFQRDCGGWPKNYDMAAILDDNERAAVAAAKSRTGDVTFDNDTCHTQVAYLASAALIVERTGAPADAGLAKTYRDAARRGIVFMLSAQYPNGGFPQRWPNPKGYSAHITFNDGVMLGILAVLRDVADGAPQYAWLDDALRERCGAAVERGIACILAMQYRAAPDAARTDYASGAPVVSPFAGKLTGWGQQHDHATLAPALARKYELPSLSAGDTTEIVRFLMGVEKSSPAIVAAINAAVAWLDDVAIPGIRIETIAAAPAEYQYHNTSKDRRIFYDIGSPLIWARMYELDTDRPVFSGRDGVKRYALAEIDRDRRTGYSWYGYWPAALIEKDYPAWLAKNPSARATAGANVNPDTRRKAIPLDALNDGAHHWRYFQRGARPENPVYRPDQVREIAANILAFQLPNGGWEKNRDLTAILTPAEREKYGPKAGASKATFDNENVHSQVTYLARAYEILGDEACRDAALRGLDFTLSAQLANGGFPQYWPAPTSYAAHITYNDRVMVGILALLRNAGNRANGFGWLDAERAARCRAAAERGLACILVTQYRNADGTLTAWGQQHDAKTLLPARGRAFELPSLCSQDTAEILEFLMEYENPSPEIVRAIDAGMAWLDRSKLTGIRLEQFKAPLEVFPYHSADYDRRVVEDPNAPVIWARMYELETNRPQFCGRDTIKRYTFAEVDRDRRTGYDWYGYWPTEVYEKIYPAWRKKMNRQ